jgi:hypothetical protein
VLCGLVVSTVSSAEPPAPAPAFQVERSFVHTVASPHLQRSYDLYVQLPASYERPENAARSYPVLYLNDGPYTFQVASGVARLPVRQELFEEVILVGISYAAGEVPMESRRRDMTPTVDAAKPSATGGAREYLDFLKSEALPFVECKYRIDPKRRTLVGQSYGALFGVWVAFTEPTLFQNYVLTSPSLWYGKRTMFQSEREYAAAHSDLAANIYFAVGALERPGRCGHAECEFDMVADQAALVKRLQARRYPHLNLHARVVDGAYHETTFPVGLLWALQHLYMRH